MIRIVHISHKHETLLKWYFLHGQSITGHSASGGMLERAETYSNRDEDRRKRIEHAVKRQAQVRAGETPMSFKGEPEITAKPTRELRPAPSNEVDDVALMKFGKVSKGLVRLGRVCSRGPDVIVARYGLEAPDWEMRGFVLGGLYRFTSSGRRLMQLIIDEGQKRAARLKLTPPQMLQNDFARAGQNDDTERLCEFGQAYGDAARLMSEVSEVWNRLHEGEKP